MPPRQPVFRHIDFTKDSSSCGLQSCFHTRGQGGFVEKTRESLSLVSFDRELDELARNVIELDFCSSDKTA
jgi:hypothetical protein